jgi:hypothetical protein
LKGSLLGPQPGQVRLCYLRPHLHQHHRLQTSCSRFTDYCKTESYKDVIPDVILENRPPVNIKNSL